MDSRFSQQRTAAAEPKSADETALERRARDLEKQAKKLQEEVVRSGLGADMQPVPEPTIRDLSVPQAKPASARIRKTTLPETSKYRKPPVPPNRKKHRHRAKRSPATTEEMLGKKPEATEKTAATKKETAAAEKVDAEKPDGEKTEPVVHIADNSVSSASPKPGRPGNRNRLRWPRRPSSAITSCRRWIFSSTGHDREAHGVQGGIDGQRAAHAADARAVRD